MQFLHCPRLSSRRKDNKASAHPQGTHIAARQDWQGVTSTAKIPTFKKLFEMTHMPVPSKGACEKAQACAYAQHEETTKQVTHTNTHTNDKCAGNL